MSNPFNDLQVRLKLSDNECADYLGVPVYTFRKWATGERNPSAAVVRLLEVLGMIEAMNPTLHASLVPAKSSPRKSAMAK